MSEKQQQAIPAWLSSILLELPVNNEFCWMHLGRPYGGGWTCQHPDCVNEEQLLRRMLDIIVGLQGEGYNVSERDGKVYVRRPVTGLSHQMQTTYDLYDLCALAKASMPANPIHDEAAEIVATIWQEVAVEDMDVTEKRGAIHVE